MRNASNVPKPALSWPMAVALTAMVALGCSSPDGPDPAMTPPDQGAGDDVGVQMDASASSDQGDIVRPDAAVDAGTVVDASAPDAGGLDCDAPFQPVSNPPDDPPFAGTAYITSDLITSADPSAFVDLTYDGQASRTMYDRRVAQFITVNAHLFSAQFGTTQTVEVRVNPEFSRADAETEARRFSTIIGQIPAFLMRDVDTISINAGAQDFGGGNRDILIHTGQAEIYESTGSLEEIIVHEASHTSMDAYHAAEPGWLEAAAADGVALSTYARDNPNREDVAETVGPFLAARLRPDRVDAPTVQQIEAAIPNRLRYLECLGLTMDIVP